MFVHSTGAPEPMWHNVIRERETHMHTLETCVDDLKGHPLLGTFLYNILPN